MPTKVATQATSAITSTALGSQSMSGTDMTANRRSEDTDYMPIGNTSDQNAGT